MSKCIICGKPIAQYFPVGWCHIDSGNIHCYPDAKAGSMSAGLTAKINNVE